jgi:hypothetical protein
MNEVVIVDQGRELDVIHEADKDEFATFRIDGQLFCTSGIS